MTKVVGHRGAAGLAPENTLKGFRLAMDLGVDYVECDVRLSRDGQVVLMHDATVDRTTDGSGAVGQIDLAALCALDAGGGERVPTLDEVLAMVGGRTPLLCELKGEGVEDAAVDAVRARRMEDETIFISFSMERLANVKRRHGRLRVGALAARPSQKLITRAADLGAISVGIYYDHISLETIERAGDAGIEVWAWTPNTLAEQQALIAMGVTTITSDRPDILLDYLRRHAGRRPRPRPRGHHSC